MYKLCGYCIPYIDGPLGKWKLSNIQYTFFIHQREVVLSSYFTFLNFRKKYQNQYFHNHSISLTLLFDPLLIFAFLVLSVHTPLNRSSYLRSLSPGTSLVALLCIVSSMSTSFLRYGHHVCIQCSKRGLTIALYKGTIKQRIIIKWCSSFGVLLFVVPNICYHIILLLV